MLEIWQALVKYLMNPESQKLKADFGKSRQMKTSVLVQEKHQVILQYTFYWRMVLEIKI